MLYMIPQKLYIKGPFWFINKEYSQICSKRPWPPCKKVSREEHPRIYEELFKTKFISEQSEYYIDPRRKSESIGSFSDHKLTKVSLSKRWPSSLSVGHLLSHIHRVSQPIKSFPRQKVLESVENKQDPQGHNNAIILRSVFIINK